MDARAVHSSSPQPSPHGAIGEFPGGVSSPLPSAAHQRSGSYAPRPRTPLAPPSSSGDELDLTALMAHGQRQLELDHRSRFGRFAAASARSGSPSRWDEEWRGSSARSRESSMRRQPSAQSATGGSVTPVAPTPNLSFLDTSFPSPIGAVGGAASIGRHRGSFATPANPAPPATDPAATATHHLNALQSVLNPLIAQSEEVIRLRAEVELWRGEWQRCDRERRRLDGIVATKNNEPVNGQAFSVVLLDGDGLIFQDEYLRKGFAGGQQAARTLATALPGLADTIFSPQTNDGGIEANGDAPKHDLGSVIVQVFVNKSGLGHALLRAGSVPSWTVYDGFWQGFSSAHDLFSVIDAGHGKEATDAKIREHLRLYSSHRQCSTIILGATHDNGYANVLSSLETTSGLSKLVLLKGYSELAAGLKPYASRCVTVNDLFRTSRVPNPNNLSAALGTNGNGKDNGGSGNTANGPAVSSRAPPSPRSPRARRGYPARAQPKEKEEEDVSSIDDPDSDSDSTSEDGNPDVEIEVIEWEGLVDSSPHSAGNPGTGAPPRRGVNAATRLRVPRSSMHAQHSQQSENEDGDWEDNKKKATAGPGKKYKPAARSASVPTVRNLKPRPCHTFYLSPWGCKNGDGCEYAHHYKLNEEQTEELARLAKEIICPYVRSKRCHFSEDECVYGHRCPRGERCTFGDTCRFKDLPNGHGEDSRAAAAQ